MTVITTARVMPDLVNTALSNFGSVQAYDGTVESLSGTTVFVAIAIDPVDASLIANLPETTKLIANIGVGTDNIDLHAAAARGIAVSNTPVVTEDTADLTMALMLAACRKLTQSEAYLRAGDWATASSQIGTRVHGKTLGIIGFGAIGQAVAKRSLGFEMNVIYHGPSKKPEAAALGAIYKESLKELLAEADIVSLNCPLTTATRHLINAETLALFKPHAILINTGRGALVDEAALVKALQSGQIAGAGLDVFEFEPQINPGLFTLDNVTMLAHIGSATAECRQDMVRRVLANIQSTLQTGAPIDAVPA